jgi:hypothetical protein
VRTDSRVAMDGRMEGQPRSDLLSGCRLSRVSCSAKGGGKHWTIAFYQARQHERLFHLWRGKVILAYWTRRRHVLNLQGSSRQPGDRVVRDRRGFEPNTI